jgi:hypothetical protein
MSAPATKTRPHFACERLLSVLVVFELDHRLILLEPFQMLRTSQFCAIFGFQLNGYLDCCIDVQMRRCNMCSAASASATTSRMSRKITWANAMTCVGLTAALGGGSVAGAGSTTSI